MPQQSNPAAIHVRAGLDNLGGSEGC